MPKAEAIELDDWQREALEHDGHLLLCTGRQIGKTTIMAIKAGKYMVEHKNAQIICVSLTEDQAQLMIIMVLDWLERNHKAYIEKGAKRPTKNKVLLNNGSSILARPVGNTGDAVRGFTGDVLIIDEASKMAQFIFDASTPTLMTTSGQIWLCSTPFGKHGYFYECYLNKNNRYKVIEKSSWDAIHERPIRGSWTQKKREGAIQFLKEEQLEKSPIVFAQEYLGKFMDDLRQFFDDNLVKKCMTRKRPERIEKGRDYVLGVDVARMGGDETVFSVFELTKHGKLVQVESQISKQTKLTETYNHIKHLNMLYDFNRIYVDDEGIGIAVFDMLTDDPDTMYKTVALRNSKKVIDPMDETEVKMLKGDLYFNLLKMMEKGDLELLDDPEIFLSFKSVQYEYTNDKKGKPFLHIFGNYTHIVEADIRAGWFVKEKGLNPFVDYI